MAKDITLSIDGDTTKYPSWATEDTLQQIAKQLGAKRSGVNSLDVSAKESAKATKELGKFAKKSSEALEEVAGFAGTLAGTISTTKGQFTDLVPVVDAFAKTLGKTVAALLSGVPFLSGLGDAAGITAERLKDIFAFIAGVADNLGEGFRGVTSMGVTFEGSLSGLVQASSKARIAIEDLPDALSQATSVLAAFSSANQGASAVLRGLGAVQDGFGDQLIRLGLTFDEINEAGIGFFDILARSGNTALLQAGNEERLAQATADYTKNLVVLSRLTGQDRKELERQIRERMMQGNIQAQLALMNQDASADQVLAFQKLQGLLDAFGPSVGNSLGAITTLGVASAESEAVLAQLGGSRDLIEQFAEAFKSGTLDENTANNLIQEILNELAGGVLDPNTLQTALLAPAGGFGQTIADTVAQAIPIAQGIEAGKSLDDLAKSVDDDTKAQNTQAQVLLDAQAELAKLPFAIQDAAVSTEGFDTVIKTTSQAAEKFAEVLVNLINKDFSDLESEVEETKDEFEELNNTLAKINDNLAQNKGTSVAEAVGGDGGVGTTGALNLNNVAGSTAIQNAIADYDPDLANRFSDWYNMQSSGVGAQAPSRDDMIEWIRSQGVEIADFNKGTAGILDFASGQLAELHGKEAVIPAPNGNIPVDLGAEVKNLLAQNGVNSVQSKEVVGKLNEMIGVLKTIADGQYTGNSQFGKEIRRLGNQMSTDLFR